MIKFILIVATLLLAEVANSAEHKSGGNCGLLAGNFRGTYMEQAPTGIQLAVFLSTWIC